VANQPSRRSSASRSKLRAEFEIEVGGEAYVWRLQSTPRDVRRLAAAQRRQASVAVGRAKKGVADCGYAKVAPPLVIGSNGRDHAPACYGNRHLRGAAREPGAPLLFTRHIASGVRRGRLDLYNEPTGAKLLDGDCLRRTRRNGAEDGLALYARTFDVGVSRRAWLRRAETRRELVLERPDFPLKSRQRFGRVAARSDQ